MIVIVLLANYGITRRVKAITPVLDWLAKKTGIGWLENQTMSIADMEDKIYDFYNRRGSVLFLFFFWRRLHSLSTYLRYI